MEPPQRRRYGDFLRNLDALKTDDEIAGIIFKIDDVSVGWATLQEIRNKLHEFQETGKETIGYLESGGNGEYLLAAAMDRTILMPAGGLNLTGLRAEVMFYKGLLDKLDIQADMIAMGKYKSGVEPYMREGMSDAFRESMTTLLDDLYAQLLSHIAENRDGITVEGASGLVDPRSIHGGGGVTGGIGRCLAILRRTPNCPEDRLPRRRCSSGQAGL